ncbi:MAG: hypothetical protein KF718_06280 [Polyangiaceae bacterium]|nr:hypothetical protein [Polyangiaceae bacterium]
MGADGAQRCGPPIECLPLGELCADDAQCCKQAGKTRCREHPPGSGPKRCHPDPLPPCASGAAECVLPTACCSGFCLPAPDGYQCAARCAPDGAPCTLRDDCCDQLSDCLTIGGQRRCAPVVR